MSKAGRCVISATEFQEMKIFKHEESEQAVMRLMKKKGAPMKGCVRLELDPDYIYTRVDNPAYDHVTMSWRPRNESIQPG